MWSLLQEKRMTGSTWEALRHRMLGFAKSKTYMGVGKHEITLLCAIMAGCHYDFFITKLSAMGIGVDTALLGQGDAP